ncbi:MAG: DMT family transporter, partial [Rhizobacter sp.]
MALVGSYVGLSKVLVLVFPIFLLAWLRFGIAAVAMLGWVKRGVDEAPLNAHDRRLLFLESFFGNFLFSICMLYGVSLSTALAAGVIMAGLPAMVALMSWAFLKERIATRVMLGIACAVAGIALVSVTKHPGAADTGSSLWGNLLLLGALTCEASYVVIGKKLTGRVSPKRISALINLWGLGLVAPFGLWQTASFDFSTVAAGSWWLLLFYSIAASVVTVWLWMTGLKHVPASAAGVFTVLLPV